jgi:S-adenosylmethionine decarboxylase
LAATKVVVCASGMSSREADSAAAPLGIEWVIDAGGCSAGALGDAAKVNALIEAVVAALGLHPVGRPILHKFPEKGGITALLLLSESHLAVHTFPELEAATLNLYCCRPRPPFEWRGVLERHLGAKRVFVRTLARGMPE